MGVAIGCASEILLSSLEECLVAGFQVFVEKAMGTTWKVPVWTKRTRRFNAIVYASTTTIVSDAWKVDIEL